MAVTIRGDEKLGGVWFQISKTLECRLHRRYQAKRKPRVPCEACWRMFIAVNG